MSSLGVISALLASKMLLKRNPDLSKKELLEAREIYAKFGEGKNTQKIAHLLHKLP